jgi:hypothetical protein
MLQTSEAKQKSLNRKGAKDAKVFTSLKPRMKAFLCDLGAFAVNAFDFSGFAR